MYMDMSVYIYKKRDVHVYIENRKSGHLEGGLTRGRGREREREGERGRERERGSAEL